MDHDASTKQIYRSHPSRRHFWNANQQPGFIFRAMTCFFIILWTFAQVSKTNLVLKAFPDLDGFFVAPKGGIERSSERTIVPGGKSWSLQRFQHRDGKELLDFVNSQPERSCPPGLYLASDTRTTLECHRLLSFQRYFMWHRNLAASPKKFLHNLDNWRLSGYSVLFHNDATGDALLQRYWPEFPELPKLVHCLLSGAGKADLWRALVLWESWGIYANLDSAPNVMFDDGRAIADTEEAFLSLGKVAG